MSEEIIVNYAIPGNEQGGRLFVFGNKDAANVIIFCGGFPDDCGAFCPLAKRLAGDKTMLCGVTCMPGYDTHHGDFKAEGYTFDETVASLREATKTLRALSTNPKAKLTGVFHDWGSVVGAMCSNRMNTEKSNYFADLVYFDVLPPAHESLQIFPAKNFKTFKTVAIRFSYMGLFAITHALQRFVSYYIAAPLLALGYGTLVLTGMTPTRHIDSETFNAREPKLSLRKTIYMQYPYFNVFTGMLLGLEKEVSGFHLPVSVADTPVLYMYGIDKNIQFHNDKVLAWLEKEGAKKGLKSRVVPVEKAGHWLYVQQEDVCYETVKRFVLSK